MNRLFGIVYCLLEKRKVTARELADHFERKIPEKIWDHLDWAEVQKVTLKIKFDQSVAFRVFDEFDPDCIREDKDGYFTVETTYPENEWVYSYLLSFGSHAEVMEPSYVRARMKKKFAEGLALY
ncbi:WYL domain-containing protein [Sporolactobacillus sp. CPB3-1]|uniref:WYL domain-containing protein n=1 Tax=Sporolactobacillus mangiferae TaxID=2940498 RepID=A0ABT0MAK0_9BACL|nr:WYL domain-containing protein [Sporolactobacillus mangiferae]MCL1631618.1 WYL domain-containing protein [Sporolactobacillus mangiferae]